MAALDMYVYLLKLVVNAKVLYKCHVTEGLRRYFHIFDRKMDDHL